MDNLNPIVHKRCLQSWWSIFVILYRRLLWTVPYTANNQNNTARNRFICTKT